MEKKRYKAYKIPIDANALIRKIEDGVWIQIEDGYGNAIGREKLNPGFAFVINEMPTIDAQPVKHGKWEHERCTECGKSLEDLFSGEFYYNQEEVKYCPNCGAKMDGGKSDG